MDISAKVVMDLRNKTGVSMMACKKALVEAGGDEAKAIDILRKSGEAKALSKADRETHEGRIAAKIEGGKGVIVRVFCETDFVARNDDFVAITDTLIDTAFAEGKEAAEAKATELVQQAVVKLGENIQFGGIEVVEAADLGVYIHANNKVGALIAFDAATEEQLKKDIAMHVVASNPEVVNPDQVDANAVEEEKAIYKEQLLKEGKPEQMLEKIMEGKVRKFMEARALVTQEFVKDPSKSVKEVLGSSTVVSFVRFAI